MVAVYMIALIDDLRDVFGNIGLIPTCSQELREIRDVDGSTSGSALLQPTNVFANTGSRPSSLLARTAYQPRSKPS